MLKIGIFSKVCQVSIKTLRHWDSVGLLNPAHIDPFTSYRYYTIEQISEVNRILALRNMGLSLEQVGTLLRENLSAGDIRRMLNLRQMQLQQQIEEAQTMLTFIESRLQQLEHGAALPGYEAVLKSTESQPILSLRQVVPTLDVLVKWIEETHALARQRTDPRLIAVFYDDYYERENLEVELGFAAEDALPTSLQNGQAMTLHELPAVELMATTLHRGSWITLSQGYSFLGQWIEKSGYQIVGEGREVFHHIDWTTAEAVTEIQFPVEKAGSLSREEQLG